MKNNNQINVPQAREAIDRFKMQAASETNGYNGRLTSYEVGSVGGQMVTKSVPDELKSLKESVGFLRDIFNM